MTLADSIESFAMFAPLLTVQAAKTIRKKISAMFSTSSMAGQRAHEGAAFNRSNRYWLPTRNSPDVENSYDIPTLRDRSRDLYRNNTIGRGAIRTMVTNVIGRGLQMQSRIDNSVLGLTDSEAEEWENNTERLWREYEKEADSQRRFSFAQLQRLAYLSKLQSGEIFVLLPMIDRKNSNFSIRVKLIEADMVADPVGGYDVGGVEGIKYDPNGQPISYTVYDWKTGEAQTYQAYGAKTGRPNVLHLYTADRPGQSRGVPFLSPVIEVIKQLGDYKKSEITAAVVQSMFTAFIRSSRPESIESPFTGTQSYTEGVNDAQTTNYDYVMAPGAINRLDDGEDVTFANPTRPNSAFDSFASTMLREVGMALDIPQEILTKQFLASYSASRGAKVEFSKTVMTERTEFAEGFCQPVYIEWLTEMILKGVIKAPGFFKNAEIRNAYSHVNWIGQPMGQIDETKEILASQMRIQSGFSTHQQETSYLTGGDFEQNAKKLKRERELIGYVAPPPGAVIESIMTGNVE